MTIENIAPHNSIALFVKNIQVFTETGSSRETVLPFYADGYPGLMFQQTTTGLFVLPQAKQMPVLFLYGQTIHPIELLVTGCCQLIIFQLFPFVLKSFFAVTPENLNNDCYDISRMKNDNANATITQLCQEKEPEK